MSEFYWPALLEPASSRLEILDSAGRFQSPLNGYTRTVSRPGERMRLTMNFQNTNGAMRAALQAHIAEMRGAVHRVWAYDHANRLRGSFPATELLSNNTFANGTTGWTAEGGVTISAADRQLRGLFNGAFHSGNFVVSQAAPVTQFLPYVLRAFAIAGRGGFSGGLYDLTAPASLSSSQPAGMLTSVVVPTATGNRTLGFFNGQANLIAGDYYVVPYTSFARCALVDNSPNAFQRSDEIDNAYWSKTELTVSANANTAPDGTTTMDRLIESTANSQHYVSRAETRASVAEDWCISGVFVRSVGTRDVRLVIGRDLATNFSTCIFNLGTGTAGTPTNNGDNTNARAFIRDMGNGRVACYLVARLAASTSVSLEFDMVNAGSVSYTGDGSSAISAWRLGAARSSVPLLLGQTTTAATTGTNQALAGVLHTKGWPASTNGLLLPGDQYQLGNQIHIVTSPVNSDAAGLAVIEGYPARRSAAADNAPIIINQPMGKFFLESDANGWSNAPGLFSDAEIVLAEAA